MDKNKTIELSDMNKYIKKKKFDIILIVLYLITIIPMAFSMYNSVPASEDFSFGTHKVSDNLLIEAIGYSAWCWIHHSGRWLTFFFQKLIVPLNYHGHLGRAYGMFMNITFLVFVYLLIISLNTIYKKLFSVGGKTLKTIVFCTVTVLFTTYYYCETFNWFTGAMYMVIKIIIVFIASIIFHLLSSMHQILYFQWQEN